MITAFALKKIRFIYADGPDAGAHATLHITPERLWR